MQLGFFPIMPKTGEVADPLEAVAPMQEALGIARRVNQHNLVAGGFADVKVFEKGKLFKAYQHRVSALLNTTNVVDELLKDSIGAHANQWKVPYLRGLDIVGDNLGNPSRLIIDLEQDALVEVSFDFQYVRWRYGIAPVSAAASTWNDTAGAPALYWKVRLQGGISIDGAVQEGSGPMGTALDGRAIATGDAERAVGSVWSWVGVLPAGVHTIEAVAGMTSGVRYNEVTGTPVVQDVDSGPFDQVVICTRELNVLVTAAPAALGA
jgi:hypothetical protein